MSEESGKALRSLASAIKTMEDPSSAKIHVENSKTAINELKFAVKANPLEKTNLLDIVPAATVASTLIEIVKCVEKLSEAVHELADLAHFKPAMEPTVSPEKPQPLLHRGTVNPVLHGENNNHIIITIDANPTDSPETEKSEAPKPSQRQDLVV